MSDQPNISEAARRVTKARDFLYECAVKSPFFDDWANRFDHAKMLLNDALSALDSAHPAPMEGGETPETDAAELPLIQSGIGYTVTGRKSGTVPADFARSLERRLAEKMRQLQKANELLGEARDAMDSEGVRPDLCNRIDLNQQPK